MRYEYTDKVREDNMCELITSYYGDSLDVKALCKFFGVSRPVIYRTLNNDGLHYTKVGRKKVVSASDLSHWIVEHTNK